MFRMRDKIKLSQLHPHPQNPRKQLIIEELTDSIQETGLLSPLIVRRIGPDKFQIISGHRRKAALERLGEKVAECDVVEMSDEQAYKALMTANIQSHSLSEIEEAEGIMHMINQFLWTQDKVSKELGKSKAWVSYRVSILESSCGLQEKVHARELTLTHAREIAQLPEERQNEVASFVVDQKLSTRDTAELVRNINNPQIDDSQSEAHEISCSNMWKDAVADQDHNNSDSNELKIEVSNSRVKTDYEKFQEQIGPASEFILLVKNFFMDIQPNDRTIESLVQFNKVDEAVNYIDKLTNMLEMIKKKLANSKYQSNIESEEGKVIEFRKKEA